MKVESYDALVVGSGATGGWAAKELTEAGLSVALLEAGPLFPSFADGQAVTSEELRSRRPIQSLCSAYGDATSHLFVDDIDNPYSFPESKPYRWLRSRQVGGRLHVWGRLSLRMSDHELKAASRDGVGEDWPIGYADLAPFYDHVERFMRVVGTRENLRQLPDGPFLDPPPLSPGEAALASAVRRRWSTRRVTGVRLAARGSDAMLAAALRTGRLTLVPDAVVSHVVSDRSGSRAAGVEFVHRVSRDQRQVRGRVVVLCASAIESTRILLNSVTPQHPDGLGNSSGVLGHYLTDHALGVDFRGYAPQRAEDPAAYRGGGAYIPAFRNVTEPGVGFLRGYGAELGVGPTPAARSPRWRPRGRPRGDWYWLSFYGEVLPAFRNCVSLHPTAVDAWGVPIAHIDLEYGDNEHRMALDAHGEIKAMLEAAEFQIVRSSADLAEPGSAIHELGTARMGADPGTSVLNAFNQSWDVENLFVTDGACFTSGGYQNPTLTMMALTVRACSFIVDRLKRDEL